jgi:hypothetical protein
MTNLLLLISTIALGTAIALAVLIYITERRP